MKRYDSYKDSGVKWLGEIPSHWDVRKMKYTFSERSQKGYPNLALLAATQTHGVIKKEKYENRTVEATKGLETLKLVEEGDFVISLRSFQGGIELCHDRGIISPAYTILKSQAITPFYFKHLGKSPIFIQLLKSMVTGIREGQNIDYGKLRDNLLPIPPLKEQEAIANYLDSITSKIDAAIAQQQKMIDLLNERKQIIINQAVTKGLDPNVKMKSSGIDWIGDIPEHWEVVKIGRLFNIKAGGDAKPEFYSEHQDDYHCFPVYTNAKEEDQVYSYTSKAPFKANSITVTGRGDIGHAILRKTDFDAIIRLLVLWPRNDKTILPDYYAYFIDNVIPFFTDSAAVGQLSAKQVSLYFTLLPNINEQHLISKFLDKSVYKINSLIKEIELHISLLQERKQIIINDVVTGKVKVI